VAWWIAKFEFPHVATGPEKPLLWPEAEPLYTRATLDAAIAQARRDALEEAADLCRRAKPQGGRMWTDEQAACFDCLSHVEDAIRALADKQEGA
jgi:hypothetical protein